MRTLEDLSVEEITFCLNRYEQYWIYLNEKTKKKKLKGLKKERVMDTLCRWENQIYIIAGIDPKDLR